MTSAITTTGMGGGTYKVLLRKHILRVKPPAFGMAVAYISASGFNLVKKILDEGNVGEVRLVTDTRDGVTHPKALREAVDSGWTVRVVNDLAGTFHPKLYVGVPSFDESGMSNLCLSITGSPNISHSGFLKNGECVFWSTAPDDRKSAARAWLDCWNAGVPVTEETLATYEQYFASRNRARKPEDMVSLGIVDELPEKDGDKPRRGVSPPKEESRAIPESVASVAWAGLQTITGEYRLQVEFPKEAGLVLYRIIQSLSYEDEIRMHCVDGEVREFKFGLYRNRMFRLNIPNDTPLVPWARKHKQGIALVEYKEQRRSLHFTILPSGQEMTDITDRSFALGTWGRTPTRMYGWY